jgi:hypothetical protein
LSCWSNVARKCRHDMLRRKLMPSFLVSFIVFLFRTIVSFTFGPYATFHFTARKRHIKRFMINTVCTNLQMVSIFMILTFIHVYMFLFCARRCKAARTINCISTGIHVQDQLSWYCNISLPCNAILYLCVIFYIVGKYCIACSF